MTVPFKSLLSMKDVLTTLHLLSFLALMRYDLVYCWRPHFSAALVRENVQHSAPAFSNFHQASWMSGGVISNRATCFALSICHSAMIRGDSVRRICHIQTAILNSLLYDSTAYFYPVQLWMTYIYSIFSLLCVKGSAELVSFPFHLIIRLAGPCCC